MISSSFWVALKILPILWAPKEINKEKIITGSHVPKANNKGMTKPLEDFITKGTRAPKNKTPL